LPSFDSTQTETNNEEHAMLTKARIGLAAAMMLGATAAAHAAEDQPGALRTGPEAPKAGAPQQATPQNRAIETEGRARATDPSSGENPAFDKDRLKGDEPQDKGTDEKKK
jgi:hypothetical protein